MLIQLSIEDFHRIVCSKSEGLGGGSVAALSAALAAGLILKVCNLAMNSNNYEAFQDQLNAAKQNADLFSKRLLARVVVGPEAWGEVVAALMMPKEPGEEGAMREKAIQSAYNRWLSALSQ